ncbi:MAG: hypothetical protein H7333_11345, partial [Bdellovibrionales bacterium]|nr:hypothetical protein [Oligoflexia bacterium]
LRADAVWEDGSPVTSDDAEFTFNTLMDVKTEAAPLRTYFEGYKFEKVDAHTIRFTTEKPNVSSVDEINDDFLIMQKKQYQGIADFNKAKGIISPLGNGPYKLKSFSRDQKLEFERNKDWWGYKIPAFKNQHNFDLIVWRIIPDTALSYEKLVKGEIDVLLMNAELFGTRVKGSDKDKFGPDANTEKAMWAQHFQTKMPAQWTYIGWNLKRPMFQSKKTRQALAMLINYDEIIDKVYHNEATRCVSPFGSTTPNTPPGQKAKAFQYNPAKGIALLKEDGWSDMDHDNTLAKMIDGKKVRFEFTLRYNSENPMRSKISQMLKEQFKKAGITINVQAPEFNSLIQMMDNRDFDALVMGWGNGMLNADSKQIWHSKSFENKGSNAVGYSNPEVDKLIEKASEELNVQKHFLLNQKIAAMIYDDQPYAFVLEVPGYMAAFQTRKVKAKKWAMKYDGSAPIWMYSAE